MATKYYVGIGSDWDTAANWADTSGGTGPPTDSNPAQAGDDAIFDDNSGDCTLDANAACDSLTIGTVGKLYANTLDAAGFDIAIGTGGLDCTYGSSAILTMGSGTWTCSGNWDAEDIGTLNYNTSTLVMNGNSTSIVTKTANPLYNITISEDITSSGPSYLYYYGDLTVDVGQVFTVTNATGIRQMAAGKTATINGTISIGSGASWVGSSGNTIVTIGASGLVTGDGTVLFGDSSTINNSNSGTCWTVATTGLWNNTTLAPGTYGGTWTLRGNHVSVERLLTLSAGTYTWTGAVTFTSQAAGGYDVNTTGAAVNYVFQGDVTVDETVGTLTWTPGASGTITFSGTSSQAINFNGESVEAITIDKTTGTVSLTGDIGTVGLSFVSNPGTTAGFNAAGYNVTLGASGLDCTNGADYTINFGGASSTWNCSGVWDIADITGFSGGGVSGAVIILSGTADLYAGNYGRDLNYTITGTITNAYSNGWAANTIVQSGGSLILAFRLYIRGMDLQSGGTISGTGFLDFNEGGTCIINDTYGAANLNLRRGCDLSGSGTISSTCSFSQTVASIYTVTFGATVPVFAGNVSFTGTTGGTYTIDAATNNPNLTFRGDVSIATSGATVSWTAGSGSITFNGTSNQNITMPSAWADEMEDIVIDKTVGTIQLQAGGPFRTQGISYTANTTTSIFDANGQDVYVGTAGLDCTNGANYTLTMSTGTWTCSGDFNLNGIGTCNRGAALVVMTGNSTTFNAGNSTVYSLQISATNVSLTATASYRGVAGAFTLDAGKSASVDFTSFYVSDTGPTTINGQLTLNATAQMDGQIIVNTGGEVTGSGSAAGTNCYISTMDGTWNANIAMLVSTITNEWAGATYGGSSNLLYYASSGSNGVRFKSSPTFTGNVEFRNAGSGTLTIDNLTYNVSPTFHGNVVLNEQSGTLTYTAGSGTITFNGTSNQNITMPAAWADEMEDIVIDKTVGTIQLQAGGPFRTQGISYTANTTTSIFDANGQDVYVGTAGLDCTNGANYTLTMGSGTWTCSGDWLEAGIGLANEGTGEVVLTGGSATITTAYTNGVNDLTIAAGASVTTSGNQYWYGDLTVENTGTLTLSSISSCYKNSAAHAINGSLVVNGSFTVWGVSGVTVGASGSISGSSAIYISEGGSASNAIGGSWSVTSTYFRQNVSVSGVFGGTVLCENDSASTGKSLTFAGATTFTGNVTFDADTVQTYTVNNSGNYALTFGGNVTVSETGGGTLTWTAGSGTITFSGTSDQSINFNGESVEAITIGKTVGTVSLTGNVTTVGVSIPITYTGILDFNGNDVAINGGTFQYSSSTVDSCTAIVRLGEGTFSITNGNVLIYKTAGSSTWAEETALVEWYGTCTLGMFSSSDTTFSQRCTIKAGASLTITTPYWSFFNIVAAGILTVETGASINIPSGKAIGVFMGSAVVEGTGAITGDGTFHYQGHTAYNAFTISPTGTFDPATLNIQSYRHTWTNGCTIGSAAVNITDWSTCLHTFNAGTYTFTGNVTITATVNSISWNNTSAAANYVFRGNVAVNESGGTVTWNNGGGTITFSDTSDQSIDLNDEAVEDVTVNKTAGTVTLTGNMTTDSITVTDGTFDAAGFNVTTTGNVTSSTGAEILMGEGTWSIGGDYTPYGSTNNPDAESATILVAGNFSTNAAGTSWDAGESDWTVSGNVDFYNGFPLSYNGWSMTQDGTGKTAQGRKAQAYEIAAGASITLARDLTGVSGSELATIAINGTLDMNSSPIMFSGGLSIGSSGELKNTGSFDYVDFTYIGGGASVVVDIQGTISNRDMIQFSMGQRNTNATYTVKTTGPTNFPAIYIGSTNATSADVVTVVFDDDIVFDGGFTVQVNDGVLNINNSTKNPNLTFNGDVDIIHTGGTLNWNEGTGNTITFSGGSDQSINFNGETVEALVVNKTGGRITATGPVTTPSFTGTDTGVGSSFDPNGQTFTITGDCDWAVDFEFVTDVDAMNGCTWDISGNFTANGQTCNATAVWYLYVDGTAVASGVGSVEYCDADDGAGSTEIDASSGPWVDGDNNINWNFGVGSTYTRGQYAALPTDTADLTTAYSAGDISDVSADDGVRVGQLAADSNYAIHQFKESVAAGIHCSVTTNVRSDYAPTASSVLLQVYNHNTLSWETLDTESLTGASTDFDMTGDIPDTTNYVSGGEIAFRVYQQNLG